MPAFDWFYVIYGLAFILAILGISVLVLWQAWNDPEVETIAEARGDYRVWGEGNNG